MTRLEPTNRKQQVLYYLIYWEWFCLLDVINDSRFHKFQSRMSDIEKVHGQIARREKVKFIDRFGFRGDHNIYKAVDKQKCIELFHKYKSKKR